MKPGEPKIFLILLNWNGKKDTLACLESLTKMDYPHLHIVIVDNGSKDDSVSAIRQQYPDYFLIETGENLGFAEGNNVGIRYALNQGAEYILLLNNDTVADPLMVRAFLASMQSDPKIGILGAKTYLFDERSTFDHFGGNWNAKTGQFDLVGLRQKDDGKSWEAMHTIDYACGCALFVKREVFEQIGLLESRFFLVWEDADFCFRARNAGFSIMTCPQAKMWHKVSASFVGGKTHTSYFWWRNRLLWIERNCTPSEKLSLYFRIIIPETIHIYKLKLLKTFQLFLLSTFQSHRDHTQRRQKLSQYNAILQGIRDYLLRRFGNAPVWIYQKPKK